MLDYSLLVRERWHSTLSSSDSSDCCECSDVDASLCTLSVFMLDLTEMFLSKLIGQRSKLNPHIESV